VLVVDLFVIALAVAFEPFPLFAYILLLASERGIYKALCFLFGWVVALVVVIAIVLFATRGHGLAAKSSPSTVMDLLKFAIGVGLIIWAGVDHARRHRANPKRPSWLGMLDRVNGLAAAGLGAFVQPWVLVAAGAAVVSSAQMSHLGSYLVLLGFVIVSSSSFVAMVVYAAFWPVPSEARLRRIRGWIDTHRIQMQVVIFLVVGLWLVAHSLYQLTS
jgi:NAD/NADP transhydrogenase beta subunit